MSTLTMCQGEAGIACAPPQGRLSNFARRLVEAREHQVKRKVAAQLAMWPDDRLLGLGLCNEDIRDIRAGTFQGVRG